MVQDTGEAFVRVPLGLVALNWLRLYVPLVRESLPQNLEAFGWMHVPTHLWRAMRRNAVWIEPTLITEWGRLIREYGRSQGRHIAEEKIIASMRWSDPERDVLQVRKIALSLVGSRDIRCIWTDSLLNTSTLDIDHMFPWAAWPCGDLWNLLPTDRRVNQRLKRNRLPSAAVLSRAEGRIIDWWQQAYLDKIDTHLPEQFFQEARASLPTFSTCEPRDVFGSVTLQRIRLRHDQQVPEWNGGS